MNRNVKDLYLLITYSDDLFVGTWKWINKSYKFNSLKIYSSNVWVKKKQTKKQHVICKYYDTNISLLGAFGGSLKEM